MHSEARTAADLRAKLARLRVPVYVVAARVRIHPVRLGQLLNERITLTPAMAARIESAIAAEDGVA